MLHILTSVFNIFIRILVWGTFCVSIGFVWQIIHTMGKNKKATIKQSIALIILTVYILSFILLKIFYPELFYDIAGIAGTMMVIVGYIWALYEDRRLGKRWWNW